MFQSFEILICESNCWQKLSRPLSADLTKALTCRVASNLARGYKPSRPASVDPPKQQSAEREAGDGTSQSKDGRVKHKQRVAAAASAGERLLDNIRAASLVRAQQEGRGVWSRGVGDSGVVHGQAEEKSKEGEGKAQRGTIAVMSGAEERGRERLLRMRCSETRGEKEVHASATVLLRVGSSSSEVKIQQQLGPAIAALATTDARLLSGHAVVSVLLDMIRDKPIFSIQIDCLDALKELVRWSEESCAEVLNHNGLSVLLGLRSSASLRVRALSVQVLSVLLLNPKKLSILNKSDVFTDDVLRGLCAYVKQRCAGLLNAADAAQVSFEAAILIRKLTDAGLRQGLMWECLRDAVVVKKTVQQQLQGDGTEAILAANRQSTTTRSCEETILDPIEEQQRPKYDPGSQTWRNIHDVPPEKLWMSDVPSISSENMKNGVCCLIDILMEGKELSGSMEHAGLQDDRQRESYSICILVSLSPFQLCFMF